MCTVIVKPRIPERASWMNNASTLFAFPFISGSETGTSAISGTAPENKHKNTGRTDEHRRGTMKWYHNRSLRAGGELPRRVSTAPQWNRGYTRNTEMVQGHAQLAEPAQDPLWQALHIVNSVGRTCLTAQPVQSEYVVPLKALPGQYAGSNRRICSFAHRLNETDIDAAGTNSGTWCRKSATAGEDSYDAN